MNTSYRLRLFIFFVIGVLINVCPVRLVAQCTSLDYDTLAWKRYPIEIYCNKTSVIQGQSINIYVGGGDSIRTATNPQYKIKIFRVGVSDELYQTITDTSFKLKFKRLHGIGGTNDTLPAKWYSGEPKPYDFKTGCSWSISYTLSIPTNWKSGFYYVKCSLVSDSTISRRAPFVVKEAVPGRTSNILYKVPFNTYYAYNSWGGGNLYGDTYSLVQDKDIVSFLRPFGGRCDQPERTDIGSFDLAERYFIQWAEEAGYVMEYCTNVDLDSDYVQPSTYSAAFIKQYKFIVTSGHDEYWAPDERSDVEDAFIPNQIASGNAAFLSGNVCYWRVDYLDNRTRMQCLKSQGTTYNWRDGQNKPEAKFIGVQWAREDFIWQGGADTVRLRSHWLFNGTQLANGSPFGYGITDAAGYTLGIAGGEVDTTVFGTSPSNTQILSTSFVQQSNGAKGHHQSGFHIDTLSSARVFGAGAIYWSRGLESRVDTDKANFRTIMTNLMDHFSEKKFVGNIYNPVLHPLIWNHKIELDGNVNILAGKQLTLSNSMTLTIDAGDTLFVNGTLQVNDGVTINGSGIVKVNPSGTMNISKSLATGWNMVSVPINVSDFRSTTLYSGANSSVFAYDSIAEVGYGYVAKDTLKNGRGYWVKFNSGTTKTYSGTAVESLGVSLRSGWNLIGSISTAIATSKLDTIHLSRFYEYYDGGYHAADTLKPGRAYWVKANTAFTLILNPTSTLNLPQSAITAVPPAPPPPDAPTLNGAAYLYNGSYRPSLSWNATGTTYQLYSYTCPNPGGDCYDGGSSQLLYSGSATSFIDYGVIIGGKFSNTRVYYYVYAIDTYDQSSAQSNRVNYTEDLIQKQAHNGLGEDHPDLPKEISLAANYPNPFNPTTTIYYTLPEDKYVTLTVYNVLGQEVKRLVDGTENAGYKTATFDANNLQSGVYYYRFTAGNFTQVKKMLLLK
jgi:hypothetical protein